MSSLADFWAGYICGSVAILIGNPLDVLKVKLQASSPPRPSSAPDFSSSSSSPPTATSAKTYLRRLIAGTAAPVLGYGALNALLFVSYKQAEEVLNGRALSVGGGVPRDGTKGTNLWTTFLAGGVGGLATWVVSTPTELVKCRAQLLASHPSSSFSRPRPSSSAFSSSSSSASASPTSPARPSSPRRVFPTSSWSVLKATWRAEGLRGLFLGGIVTALRDSIGYGFYFWSYELAWRWWASSLSGRSTTPTATAAVSLDSSKAAVSPAPTAKDSALGVLVCGGFAGVVTWTSIFPLDVIKTRVQTQPHPLAHWHGLVDPAVLRPLLSTRPLLPTQPYSSSQSDGPLAAAKRHWRPGTWEVVKEAYREAGWRVFFRGWAVCSARAFVVNAVQWAAYEWIMRQLGQEKTGARMRGGEGAELMMD